MKEYEPPTISCSVSPTTIKPGDSATITATAASPQNRPLTYTYTASAGTVSGTGASATYSSTGAPTGSVSITCNVADDKGHNASANSSLNILAPPPPPQPHAQALCSINFETDKKRPTRVDNEAKACLDEVALDLQRQADAKAVVVGSSNAKEKEAQEKKQKLEAASPPSEAGGRLCRGARGEHQGLPGEGEGHRSFAHQVSTSATDGQKVEDYLVPAGANFNSRRAGHDGGGRDRGQAAGSQAAAARKHSHHTGGVEVAQLGQACRGISSGTPALECDQAVAEAPANQRPATR